MKYLRKEDAKNCELHRAIRIKCLDDLTSVGAFHKNEVLEELGYMTVSDSIRWDYIKEFIERPNPLKKDECELIPVNERFFHWRRNRAERRDGVTTKQSEARETLPEKLIAGGNGRRTAGYVLAGNSYPSITITKLKLRYAMADGHKAGADDKLTKMVEREIGVDTEEAKKLIDDLGNLKKEELPQIGVEA